MKNILTAKARLINGMVKRFERGDMIIDLGNNLEAILPKQEQVRNETWTIKANEFASLSKMFQQRFERSAN